MTRARLRCLAFHLPSVLACLFSHAAAEPPVDFKVAFIADQGLGPSSLAVLQLIQSEGAQAVVHSGDFDYEDDPLAWENQINSVLGADFPYFASIGNHDTGQFDGPGGYQEFLQARMLRLGLSWDGDLGVRSAHEYAGILFLLTGPGTRGSDHASYIRDMLATSSSLWRISSWHRNMRPMQVGHKSNDTGWEVYEESRRGAAIIATGHEHSYSRTHLLSNMEAQVVASISDTLVLREDDPTSTAVDEGNSFVFVCGLGGRSIRDQHLSGPWWASVYTSTQGANHGALFAVFNAGGDARLARFYFKSIDGLVVDEFYVRSTVQRVTSAAGAASAGDGLAVELLPGTLVGPRLSVHYALAQPQPVSLFVYDARGRLWFTPFAARPHAAGAHSWEWELDDHHAAGVYFLRVATPVASRTLRFVVLE